MNYHTKSEQELINYIVNQLQYYPKYNDIGYPLDMIDKPIEEIAYASILFWSKHIRVVCDKDPNSTECMNDCIKHFEYIENHPSIVALMEWLESTGHVCKYKTMIYRLSKIIELKKIKSVKRAE